MSLLGQLLPNSYEAGAVRTYRDVLSRTGAISAALARSGQLNAETDSRIEDFHRCLLAVLDGTGRHSRVRAATDGILADSADERDTLADRLLGRRGTLKLFSRLASVLSSLESDPAGVWQAYRVMMESYLSRMGYPVGMAPRPNIYASARRVAQIPAEFDQTYREVSNVFPHAGRVAFLEECVRRGSCLERCRDISASAMAELLPESCEYWDYRNVLRLAQTAERLDESRLSVSLSGGNSNGLAHLGALESLTDEDGTLSDSVGLIAGTSMGGIMAALAAVAPVPRLQRDIVEGFSLAGRSYRLEGHTSDARDRERIVEFFLALGRRYGIRENTRFSDLPIPVVVAASRDLPRGAQKVLL